MNKKNKRSFGDFLRVVFVKNFWLKLLALVCSVAVWLLVSYLFIG